MDIYIHYKYIRSTDLPVLLVAAVSGLCGPGNPACCPGNPPYWPGKPALAGRGADDIC